MRASTMFVGWDSPNGFLVSQRVGAGHDIPELHQGEPQFTLIPTPPSYVSFPAGTKLKFSILIADDANVINTKMESRFIFAFSNTPPKDPTSVESFPMHDSFGRFKLDVSKSGDSTASELPVTHDKDKDSFDYVSLHAWLMFCAWAVLTPAAIFTARYLKASLSHRWYNMHKWLMVLVALLTIFAYFALIANKKQEQKLHARHGRPRTFSRSAHKFVGKTLVFFAIPVQIALGFVINHLFRQSRTHVPWWDRVHWWVGRAIAFLTLLNIFWGLFYFQARSWVIFLYICWVIGGAGAFWWFG
ncbi:hypothetical protein BDR26DRAFT_852137, partial [Obelidium mucronatum]